ncbi:MAG: hypothetical protein U5R06_23060 [candidate division KSB1 bacterium]|nr:hypothetical protein [candidate division KSB1 bacterium]
MQNLTDHYNVTYSTHTHGPVCKVDGTPYGSAYCNANHHSPGDHDTHITQQDIVNYVDIRRSKFSSLSDTEITDHNGNFDMINQNLLFDIGMHTLSAFKNKNTQKSYDYLFTNPWRPSVGNALADISTFTQHDPDGKLIYLPGVGSNLTKRHERVPLKVQRFVGQFIKHADPERVNVMNLVLHVDAFEAENPADDSNYIHVKPDGSMTHSEEFEQHLEYWDDMLTTVIDPLVQTGYLQWNTGSEIADAFIAWESRYSAGRDSIFTYIPSETAGERGIATLIRLPQQGRFGAAAPVVIYVAGGFSGEGLSTRGCDLTEQGFIELYFNFPGSGRPGTRSGGIYDTRGTQSINALKDVVQFALGQTTDSSGSTLADYCETISPLQSNVGLVGWSNGGNATLAAAGCHAQTLSDLAWIVNWESPVGDGMPTAEAGAKGGESNGNPETNPAYDPDIGTWDMSTLKYDATVNINQHHAGQETDAVFGGFYFDINDNGMIDENTDFIPFPIVISINDSLKAFYSQRITQYAWSQHLLPGSLPAHLTTPRPANNSGRCVTVKTGLMRLGCSYRTCSLLLSRRKKIMSKPQRIIRTSSYRTMDFWEMIWHWYV